MLLCVLCASPVSRSSAHRRQRPVHVVKSSGQRRRSSVVGGRHQTGSPTRCPRPPRSSCESAGAWPGLASSAGEVSCVIWVDAGRMLGHRVPWTAWALGTAQLAKADRLETLQPVPRRQSDNGNGRRAINTCIILT